MCHQCVKAAGKFEGQVLVPRDQVSTHKSVFAVLSMTLAAVNRRFSSPRITFKLHICKNSVQQMVSGNERIAIRKRSAGAYPQQVQHLKQEILPCH